MAHNKQSEQEVPSHESLSLNDNANLETFRNHFTTMTVFSTDEMHTRLEPRIEQKPIVC